MRSRNTSKFLLAVASKVAKPVRPVIMRAIRLLASLPLLALLLGCEAFTWGDNDQGQLGVGTFGGMTASPGAAASGFEWRKLEAGHYHNCGIRDDGTLWCWGLNNTGQLGVGYEDIDSAVPLQVGTATDWSAVSPGYRHTCGIRAGQMWCWGLGTSGQIGNGIASGNYTTPVRVGTESDWTEVSTGVRFTCGIRGDAELYCWGRNNYGQLGQGAGDYINRGSPQLVMAGMKGVDAGFFHACAIKLPPEQSPDDPPRPMCWGYNEQNQVLSPSLGLCPELDDGTEVCPFPVGPFVAAQEVRAGNDASCYRQMGGDLNNAVFCWGNPAVGGGIVYAPLGFRFVGCITEPCEETASLRFVTIDLDTSTACGLAENTRIALCWGEGSQGQIGDGSFADTLLPRAVSGGKRWHTISTGREHTLALEPPEQFQ